LTPPGLQRRKSDLVQNGKSSVRTRRQLPAMTTIRFFAAVAVVLRHYAGLAAAGLPMVVRQIFSHGFVAVSFFFVLSGFILTYQYQTDAGELRGSRRKFWIARFARIYPVYLFAFCLSVPMWWVRIRAVHSALGTTLRLIVNGVPFLFLIQSWTPWTANSINSPAWSLSNEAFFYTLFPFLLPRLARLSLWRNGAAIFAGWAIVLGMSALCCRAPDILPASEAKMALGVMQCLPIWHLPEFFIGMLVARFVIEQRAIVCYPSFRLLMWLSGLLLILACSSAAIPELVLGNGLLAPAFALLLMGSTQSSKSVVRSVLESKPLVFLGEISYSLYILQEPLARIYEAISTQRATAAFLPYFLLLLVGAGAAYLLIEKPLQRYVRSWLERCEFSGRAITRVKRFSSVGVSL
jgi:peptidoglycan/LPS O-acetylase OafA/YrhL